MKCEQSNEVKFYVSSFRSLPTHVCIQNENIMHAAELTIQDVFFQFQSSIDVNRLKIGTVCANENKNKFRSMVTVNLAKKMVKFCFMYSLIS